MFTKETTRVIEIKPLSRERWHGKKGPESFARPVNLEALVDGTTMSYATGLTTEEIKELKKHVAYDLTNNFDAENPHPFWSTRIATLKLPNHTIYLPLSNPIKYIHYKMALASKFIANSQSEADQGLWPDATHVISDDKEVAEIEVKKIELEEQAIMAAQALTLDRKQEIIMVLAGKNTKGQSEAFVKVELSKLLKADPEAFLNQTNVAAEDTSARALVIEAVDKGVLRKDGVRIMWFESSIGSSVEEAARYLSNDKNQDIRLLIEQKLQD